MNLYLKQRVFSWGDKFAVYDANGDERYHVQGEVFSWGKKLHVYDLNGEEIAFIQQKVLSFLPKYHIFRDGVEIAEVVKEFTFFRNKYTVNGLGWQVDGDFMDHDYSITDGMGVVVEVSKEWFTFGDAYHISIAQHADEINALAVVLVIDACIEAQQNN